MKKFFDSRRLALWLGLLLALSLALPVLGAAPAFAPANELERLRQALYGFLDSAFSVEFGSNGRNFMVRWNKPVTVSLEGDYTPEDEVFFDAFINGFDQKMQEYGAKAFPGISRVDSPDKARVRVIYCKLDEMDQYMEFYEPDNWGLFEYWYDDYVMTRGTVTIATDVTKPVQRNHLLMEELVGTLGLTNDIYTYSDSIVYQPWTETQQLSDMDWLMLSYLYSSRTKSGMTAVQAYEALLPLLAAY